MIDTPLKSLVQVHESEKTCADFLKEIEIFQRTGRSVSIDGLRLLFRVVFHDLKSIKHPCNPATHWFILTNADLVSFCGLMFTNYHDAVFKITHKTIQHAMDVVRHPHIDNLDKEPPCFYLNMPKHVESGLREMLENFQVDPPKESQQWSDAQWDDWWSTYHTQPVINYLSHEIDKIDTSMQDEFLLGLSEEHVPTIFKNLSFLDGAEIALIETKLEREYVIALSEAQRVKAVMPATIEGISNNSGHVSTECIRTERVAANVEKGEETAARQGQPIEPGAIKPVAQSKRVMLFGPDEQPIVTEKRKSILPKARYDVVQALIEAGESGLSKDDLDAKSGHSDARKLLYALVKNDSDWKAAILLPGKGGMGKHYRTCSCPPFRPPMPTFSPT